MRENLTKTIRAGLVAACAIALIASAGTSPHQGGNRARCTTPDGEPGFVNGVGECQGPPKGVYRIEALDRRQSIREENAVEDMTVNAKPYGAAAWTIRISNTGDESASVLWDESSFVSSDGRAAGRLIRGETRKIDTGKTQPPEPVPPGSAAVSTVFAEKLIGLEEVEEKIATTDLPMEQITKARELRKKTNAAIVGGKIHLTIDIAGTKKTWTGIVEAL